MDESIKFPEKIDKVKSPKKLRSRTPRADIFTHPSSPIAIRLDPKPNESLVPKAPLLDSLLTNVFLLFGQYHWFHRAYQTAREILAEAKKMYLMLNKPVGVAHCDYWMSRAYYGDKNYAAKTRRTAEAAFLVYQQLGYRDKAGETLNHLCCIFERTRCYNEAVRRGLQGICIYHDIGGPGGITQGLQGLGDVYFQMGRYDEAVSVYKQAIQTKFHPILVAFDAQVGEAQCLHGIAEVYRHQLRFEDAECMDRECEKMGINIMEYET
ncbi:hypothetical protein BDZ94DRAFT_1299490 [Collybia nuda]|uniref:Tetratricopeptide repeat protein n=1 Tax=Collybia nuda TaxID=64659 RepID=A0A9P5Y0F4_9AGAR|nr:hypothetical protein BDZ94DRAFT_1299490 [Collybia nuda]